MVFYELYRVKEVTERFFKDLKRLRTMDETIRRVFSQSMRDALEPVINIRNTLTHKHMAVLDPERKAWALALVVEATKGGIADKITGELWQPAEVVGEIAETVASDAIRIAQPLFRHLQRLSNRLAKAVVEDYKTL